MLKEKLICIACDGTGAIDRLRVSCINCGGDGKLKNGATCAKCLGCGETGRMGTPCFDCQGEGVLIREKMGLEEYREIGRAAGLRCKGRPYPKRPGQKRNRGPHKEHPVRPTRVRSGKAVSPATLTSTPHPFSKSKSVFPKGEHPAGGVRDRPVGPRPE